MVARREIRTIRARREIRTIRARREIRTIRRLRRAGAGNLSRLSM
jgi:hypothetical protein